MKNWYNLVIGILVGGFALYEMANGRGLYFMNWLNATLAGINLGIFAIVNVR
jgi:hypothetical protein